MGKIKTLKNNELVGGIDNTSIYPVTSTSAVFNSSNKNLDTLLADKLEKEGFEGTADDIRNKTNQKFYFDAGGFCRYLIQDSNHSIVVYNLIYQDSTGTYNLCPSVMQFQLISTFALLCKNVLNQLFIADSNEESAWESLQTDINFETGKSVVLVSMSNGMANSSIPVIQKSLYDKFFSKKTYPKYNDSYDFIFGIPSDFEHNFTTVVQEADGLRITGGSNMRIRHKKHNNSKEHNFSAEFKIVSLGTILLLPDDPNDQRLTYPRYNSVDGSISLQFGSIHSPSSTLVSDVGDNVRLSLFFYYDQFTFVVENLTKGTSEAVTINVPIVQGMNLLPILQMASLYVESGTILLKKFTNKQLRNDREIKFLILGDSISSCYFVGSRSNSFQFKLFEGNEDQMSTIGFPGGKVTGLMQHLVDIASIKPMFVLCYLGTNDVPDTPLNNFKSQYIELCNAIKAIGSQPIICTLPAINSVIPVNYNITIYEIAKMTQAFVVDLSTAGLVASDYSADGVHLVASGAQKIASRIRSDINWLLDV